MQSFLKLILYLKLIGFLQQLLSCLCQSKEGPGRDEQAAELGTLQTLQHIPEPPRWGPREAPGHPVLCRALEMLQVLSPEPPCPGPCTVRSGTRNPPRQPLSVRDQGVDPQAEPRMPSCQQGLLLLQHFPFPWTFTNCVNTSPAPAAYGANSIVKTESTSKAQVKPESTGLWLKLHGKPSTCAAQKELR